MRQCEMDCLYCEKLWCDERVVSGGQYEWRRDWFRKTEDEFGEYSPDDFED